MSEPIIGINDLLQRIRNAPEQIRRTVDFAMQDGANSIAAEAKQRAPGDFGILRQLIGVIKKEAFNYEVFSNTFYSAYVEFGTGAQVSIPATYEEYAATFKGKSPQGGNIDDFLNVMIDWVKRHLEYFEAQEEQYDEESGAIIYSKPKKLKKADAEKRIEQIAYSIVLKILSKGLRPRPFFFPAVERVRPIIIRQVEGQLKQLL